MTSTKHPQQVSAARFQPRYKLTRPVFFVGFMGAGKTSIARRLARVCHVASVDVDTYIERRAGKTISEIFAEEGEPAFRALETQALKDLVALPDPLLISCGGGVVVTPENREILKTAGFTIYLEVDADEAASRISDLSTRPLFSDIEAARKRCADRAPLYEEVAAARVSTFGKTVYELAQTIQQLLESEGMLCPQQK
jgi:shikimate kinase